MRGGLALIAAGLMLGGQPVAAREREPAGSTAASQQMLHTFGACVADRRPAQAAGILALDYTTPQYQSALRRLAGDHETCAGRANGKFNGLLFAGALAERLIQRQGGDVAAVLAADRTAAPLLARGETEVTALCIAQAAPRETIALFATTPGTPEETAAFQPIGPALVGCVKAGQQMHLNKPGLRAMLATASWRLAQSRGAPAAAAVRN